VEVPCLLEAFRQGPLPLQLFKRFYRNVKPFFILLKLLWSAATLLKGG
jgi:hypothetical protein